jgi:hypothetical protein
MELQAWRAVATSVIGTSHSKTGIPCQDSHRLEILTDLGPVVVLIASDGAGSASRSEEGSARACQELLDNIRLYIEEGGALKDVRRELASTWIENAAEAVQQAANEEGLALREFACTLLAAVVSDEHALFLQIGDGAIVFWARGEDDWCIASWPQHGEYLNTTRFLTEPTSREAFEFTLAALPVYELAVFTDGIEGLVLHYATQTVHSPFFDGMFLAVRGSEAAGFNAELSQQLASYLSSPAITERADDDITLLMASRVRVAPSKALVPIAP